MHCMLITLETQWTECEHNESGSSNCEDNTTFILTLKEQRDVSEPETCTVSGSQWELTSPIRCVLLRLKLHISMCNFLRITKTDSCILIEAKMCTNCKLRRWEGLEFLSLYRWTDKILVHSPWLVLHGQFLSLLMHWGSGLTHSFTLIVLEWNNKTN